MLDNDAIEDRVVSGVEARCHLDEVEGKFVVLGDETVRGCREVLGGRWG